MRNLKYVSIQQLRLYKKIYESKDPGIVKRKLRSAEPIIEKLYRKFNLYSNAIENYSNHLAFTPAEEAALKSAYDDPTAPLKSAKAIIKKQLDINHKCPYCDVGNAKKTFDHHLPKEIFPEFSVLTKNLIPSCFDCNRDKRTISHLPTGSKQFFHPYFDTVPTDQFVFCDIKREATTGRLTATFRLSKPTSVTQSTFDMIENHYKHLNLVNIYYDESIKILRDLAKHITNLKAVSTTTSSMIVNSKLSSLKADYGNNYFETVIYSEIVKPQNLLLLP